MGIFSGAKNVGKKVFVNVPLSIFGARQLAAGNGYMQSLWHSLTAPQCPNCAKGILLRTTDAVEVTTSQLQATHVHWQCAACEFRLLAPKNLKDTRELAQRLRAAHARESLDQFDVADIKRASRAQVLSSRAYYAAGIFGFSGLIYMIVSGASAMTCINWLVISIAMATLGLTRAYRSWQIREGYLFVEGAFSLWLRTEKWYV